MGKIQFDSTSKANFKTQYPIQLYILLLLFSRSLRLPEVAVSVEVSTTRHKLVALWDGDGAVLVSKSLRHQFHLEFILEDAGCQSQPTTINAKRLIFLVASNP